MLSGEQPCFQLLRFGSSTGDSARDLYTFRPTQNRSVFRLGRAAELCDVTLDSAAVSRIHSELHAERDASGEDGEEQQQQEESWKVYIKDRSSHGERERGRSHKNTPPHTFKMSHAHKRIPSESPWEGKHTHGKYHRKPFTHLRSNQCHFFHSTFI